ncbi:MAG: hypothetical protein ACTSXV_01045 [Alphaproteobacteria bacterium]
MITTELQFETLLRKNGSLVFLLKARNMPPMFAPKLAFNKKDCALLARDEHEDILLTNMPSQIIKALRTNKKAFILELSENGIIQHKYTSEIFIDPDLKPEE